MEPVKHIEIVDRENRVVATQAIPVDAFPLTIRLRETPVAAVTPPPLPHERTFFERWVAAPGAAIITFVITLMLLTWETYYFDYGESDIASNFLIGALFMIPAWCGIWALIGKMGRRHRPRFNAHLIWTCIMMVVTTIVFGLITLHAFLWPSGQAVSVVLTIIGMIIVSAFLAGHITIALGLTREKQWITVSVASAVLTIIMLVGQNTNSDDADYDDVAPKYDASLFSLSPNLIPAITPETFEEKIAKVEKDLQPKNSVFARRDSLAKQANDTAGKKE